MPRSRVVPAVLQTVALSACALIVSHHLISNAFENASNTELWQNITSAVNASAQVQSNGTANSQMLYIDAASNETAANRTTEPIFGSNKDNESFYWSTFPREIFLLLVISPLYYHWQIWLERFLPGRPRVSAIVPAREKSGPSEDDNREEEIVQKWIAQGKIKRASLSWWNTFCKWILNLTVGGLWTEGLRFLLTQLIKTKSPIKVFNMMLGWAIPFRVVGSFFTLLPLSSLIAFAVVPAHQRMTFEAGAGLLWDLFFGVSVNVMFKWLAKAPFVQEIVRTWVEALNNQTAAAGNGTSSSQFARLPPEL